MPAVEPRQEFKDMKAYAIKWTGKHNIIHKLRTIIDAALDDNAGGFYITYRNSDSYIALRLVGNDNYIVFNGAGNNSYIVFKSLGNNILACHPGNWINALDTLYAKALLRISEREEQAREKLEQRIVDNFETCHVWGG